MRPGARRWWAAAAWAGGRVVLFAFFLRISLGARMDSDGANNALQAQDMLHGHILPHGWLIGDATFYFFELPLNPISEVLFGLGNLAVHVASALTYLIVAVLAVALAVTGSRGPARAARCAVVVTVLAVPLLTTSSVPLLLEEPDHIGTSAFLLASFLLIERAANRRFTAPPLGLILCAGQLSDLTVRRGHPAFPETGHGTPRGVARGARTHVRHRLVLRCLDCDHAVRRQSHDPRG
jgi:hypothetical protein